MKKLALAFFLMFLLWSFVECQQGDWRNLVPLESNKAEVEKVLGKPDKYFKTYGNYKTEIGQFSVWYSKGSCRKKVEGLQWNVPPGRMTRLVVYPNKARPLMFYLTNEKDFVRQESPGGYSRYQYLSPDESIVFETILRGDKSEYVESIELQPGKHKEVFRCKGSSDVRAARGSQESSQREKNPL